MDNYIFNYKKILSINNIINIYTKDFLITDIKLRPIILL